MGADYIQYLVTDKVASPQRLEHIYSEKVQRHMEYRMIVK